MSTVCLLAQTNNVPEHLAVPLTLLLLLLTAGSPMLARAAGVFRKGSVAGPLRFSSDDKPLTFLLILIAAILATIVGMKLLEPAMVFLPEEHRPLAAGMLGTGFGFLAVVYANAKLRPDGLRLTGLTARGILPGLRAGLVGLIIILPWLFWLMLGAQLILDKLNVHIPTEHEIFRIWQKPETPRAFHAVALFSAVILAPLAEEAVFRGVLQTGLTRLFARRLPVVDIPPATSPESGPVPVLAYAAPTTPPVRLSTQAHWSAIFVASLLFALVHQPWFITIPIFLLSLGLGYVYERTGNLWAPIFMHMFFNAAQFALFLFVVR